MPKDDNGMLRKIAVGVATALVVGAIIALLSLSRDAHGKSEHSQQIVNEVQPLLEPIKIDLAEQRIILERIDRKMGP